MSSEHAIIKDIKKLHEAFYRNFDRSRAESFLQGFEKGLTFNSSDCLLLGSGSFCSAYRVSFSRNSAYYHVLSIAHTHLNESFEAERSLKQWLKRLQTLSKLNKQAIPLIPPVSGILGKQTVAWVSPFAEGAQEDAKTHWLPLRRQIEKMQNVLRKNGLIIEDLLQIRTWQGIPFIHDLSDLLHAPTKQNPKQSFL